MDVGWLEIVVGNAQVCRHGGEFRRGIGFEHRLEGAHRVGRGGPEDITLRRRLLRLDAAQQHAAAAGDDARGEACLLLDDSLHGLDGRHRVGGVDDRIGSVGTGGKTGENEGGCGTFLHGSSSLFVLGSGLHFEANRSTLNTVVAMTTGSRMTATSTRP
jgi:hypothetical protein